MFFSLFLFVALAHSLSVGPCAHEWRKEFSLVEVETGNPAVMPTTVSACFSEESLKIKFKATDFLSSPEYLTTGCNDEVNPPFKSNTVEVFIGFADRQSNLKKYLELQVNPEGKLWMANITTKNGRFGGSKYIDCAASGITAKVAKDPAPRVADRSIWTYDVEIPFRTIPGVNKHLHLFADFLRIAYTNEQFTGRKELTSFRAHGIRNFHVPEKFEPLYLTEGGDSADRIFTFESVTPSDPAFVDDKLVMNRLAKDPLPQTIYYPEKTSDVAKILAVLPKWMQVTVRAGRHSYVAGSIGNGVVIDVSKMAEIDLDEPANLVTVGAGVKNFDVQYTLANNGLAVPLGTCPSVGGGYFLGGGYSLLSRKIGMGVDAIREVELVFYNGTTVTCNKDKHPTLFWALRGAGGGNFGVVTKITLQTHAMPKQVSLVRFKWDKPEEALPLWEEFLQKTFDNEDILVQGYFSSGGIARANIFFFGPEEEILQMVQPLKAVRPTSFSHKEVSYKEIMFQFASCKDPATETGPSSCSKMAHMLPKTHPSNKYEKQSPWVAASVYVNKPLGKAKWAAVVHAIKTQYPGILVIADPAGAAIAKVSNSATAYAHRDALYHLQIMGYFSSETARKSKQDAVMGLYDFIVNQEVSSGAYYNYPNMAMLKKPNWGELYFKADGWRKLLAMKRQCDPHNMFRSAFSIPLAGATTSGVTDGEPDVPILGKCERVGGKCMHKDACTNARVTGRCSGSSDIQCCLPAGRVVEQTPCGLKLGKCVNIDETPCTGGTNQLFSRKCPGLPNNVMCCAEK